MDALELLLNRQSHFELEMPVPEGEVLANILQAGLKVPDHGKLNPYHFTVIAKDKMGALEKVLIEAVEELDLLPNRLKKAKQICEESPMIIAVSAILDKNQSIVYWEKMLTAGCAAYAVQLAARAYGFDSIWFTGDWVSAESLHKAFGISPNDKVIALLKIGTKKNQDRVREDKSLSEFVSYF